MVGKRMENSAALSCAAALNVCQNQQRRQLYQARCKHLSQPRAIREAKSAQNLLET